MNPWRERGGASRQVRFQELFQGLLAHEEYVKVTAGLQQRPGGFQIVPGGIDPRLNVLACGIHHYRRPFESIGWTPY